jgi:DNA gyrase subunit A
MSRAGYIKAVASSTLPDPGPGHQGHAGHQPARGRHRQPRSSTPLRTPTCCSFPTWAVSTACGPYEVPLQERTSRGTAIVNLLPLAPGERIQALIDTREFQSDRYLFFATKQGQVKKTAFSEYDRSRRDGLIALNLREVMSWWRSSSPLGRTTSLW